MVRLRGGIRLALGASLMKYVCVWGMTLGTPLAHAAHFYVDGGGGYSLIASGDSLLTHPDAPSISLGTGSGIGAQLGFYYGLNDPKATVLIHLGLSGRYSTYSNDFASYAVQSLYPTLRLQFENFYVGGGATPLLYRKVTAAPNISQTARAGKNALGLLAEAGFELPITPEIAFLLTGSGQLVTGGGGSPFLLDFGAAFRLFFGSYKSSTRSGKYEGYRYPYGVEKD